MIHWFTIYKQKKLVIPLHMSRVYKITNAKLSDRIRPILGVVSPSPTLATAHPKHHLSTCSSFLSSIQHYNQSPNHSFLTTRFCCHSFPTSLPFPSSVRSLLQHEEASCHPLEPHIQYAPCSFSPLSSSKQNDNSNQNTMPPS